MHFCVCNGNILWIPHFFNFGIDIGFAIPKIEFEKDIFDRGIKQKISIIALEDLDDQQVFCYKWK